MRILSCQIIGFGKFLSREFVFSAPLTCFKEENGWGKSTLADFIECMLYGMDGGRSKSVSENMRMKYQPLFSGAYGGVMLVESRGRRYRIERAFGKTPSGDSVKVYDSNNMLCYDFGERCERLGETLVGVNRESYRKTAYIAQGESGAFGLSENLKSKLVALLSTAGQGNGAQSALNILESADRALRAKRKPAKGKLDEIDEKLELLARDKGACEEAGERAERLRKELTTLSVRLDELKKQSAVMAQKIEDASRKGEYEARRQATNEIRVRVETAQAKKEELERFFNGIAPQTVNVDGVKTASAEYYALEKEMQEKQTQLLQTQTARAERESLRSELSAHKKALEANELRLENTQALKKQKRRERPRKLSKKRKILFVLAFALFLIGATQISVTPVLGYPLFAVGALGVVWQLKDMLLGVRGMGKIKGDKCAESDLDDSQKSCERIQEKLSTYPDDLDEKGERLQQEITAGQERLGALKVAIEKFLYSFAFGDIYDYRTAVERLEGNVKAYEECNRLIENGESDLARVQGNEDTQNSNFFGAEDMLSVKLEQSRLNAEREQLETAVARQSVECENLDKQASFIGGILAEISGLQSEKERLEKRLKAIRYAKELLVKAQGNTALKYLTPVENKCREYAKILGFERGASGLRFTSEASPVLEDNGLFIGADYFSDGIKELLGFCVRLALYETVFSADAPPLILDDPFVNLDDDKTAKAKSLVVELSKRAQVLYFTCKSERTL